MSAADNIAANYALIAYTDYFDIDKIIDIYTGSFSVGSTSTFDTTYVEHDIGATLTTKVYTQMIWSVNSGTTWQDGASRIYGTGAEYYTQVNCYSTSSKIYIVVENAGGPTAAPAYTMQYKVVAFSIT